MKKTVLFLTMAMLTCTSVQLVQGQEISELQNSEEISEEVVFTGTDLPEAAVPETDLPETVISGTTVPGMIIPETDGLEEKVREETASGQETPEINDPGTEEELTAGTGTEQTDPAGEAQTTDKSKDQETLIQEFAARAFGVDAVTVTGRNEDGSALVFGDLGVLLMEYGESEEGARIPVSAICWEAASNRWLQIDQEGTRSAILPGIYQFYGSSFWRIGSGGKGLAGYDIQGDAWSYYLGSRDIAEGLASRAGADGILPDAAYYGARWIDNDYLTAKGGYHSAHSGKYYFKKDGTILKNGTMKVGGRYYEFGEDGACVRSYMTNYWKQERLGYYVRVDENGNIIRTGGFFEFDGNRYYLCGNSGRRVQGWFRYRGQSLFYDEETGAQVLGYQVINGVPYYFDPDKVPAGRMTKGGVFIDGKRYYFDYENGQLVTGWIFGGANGAHKYYVNGDGSLKTGWNRIASENRTYYFEPTWGYALQGLQTIDGKKYLFVEGTDAVGRGWINYQGEKYYCDPGTAVLTTGFTEINGRNYYFDETGRLITNVTRYRIDGKFYDIDAWGHVSESPLSEAEQLAKERLDIIGWDLRSAYLWSCMDYYYNDDTVPYGYEPADYYGIYGLTHHYGDCYVMASTFYQMAKVMGYDIHFVMGYVKSVQYGMSPHGWCEIDEEDGTWVYDPDFEASKGRNGYRIYYGQPTTWMYTEYQRMN